MQETQINGESLDIVSENVSKLKELFPEIVTEDKIDFDKLMEVLGKYTEDDNERYNFTWKGKSAALRLAQTPSTGTLRPCKEESKNWNTTENLYIEGDNLEVLKLLQKSYYGKIKMIYIDPPYNTGNDFVYPDNYRDNLQNYFEITGQVDNEGNRISNNSDMGGRYHTNWLNMIYPRLRLARNLLSEDGVIFISIDNNEVENIIKICNEIYGEENKVGVISRLMKSGGNKGQYFSPNIDYILVFAKNIHNLGVFREQISDELIEKVYNLVETEGPQKGEKFRIMGLYQAGLDIRPNQRYWIECPDGSYAIPPGSKFPSEIYDGVKVLPVDGDGVWRWSLDRYQSELKSNNILFKKTKTSSLIDEKGNSSKWNIYTKIWLKDRLENGRVPVNLINKYENRHSSQELKKLKIPFDFSKPSGLIKYLISIISENKEILILDFFSGSATTADATLQLNTEDNGNRKFIMVQLPEPTNEKSEAYKAGYKNICEIGKERIRRAGDKIVSEMNQNGQTSFDSKSNTDLDIGFKVFKLDSSNLSKWDPEQSNLEQSLLDSVENLVPGRNELDLVYEIMLKYGIDLTLPIEEYPIQDKKFYSIGFGALIICLDDNLTSDLAYEIIKIKDELTPEVMRVVFKDNGFASDSDKTNIKETLKTNRIEEFVTI